MNNLIIYLKEHFQFEVVKKGNDFITVRWEKQTADKFKELTENALKDLTTSTIKIYKLGTEQQYHVYKIYFMANTEFGMEKILEAYKSSIEPIKKS